MQEYKTIVKEIKHLTMTTIELTVELVEPNSIKFHAGQCMTMRVGEEENTYPILTVPDHNQTLSFCIELFKNTTAGEIIRGWQPGQEVVMSGPVGEFAFRDFKRKALFVTVGAGVATFASIIPDALGRGYSEPCQLVFGVHHEEDVFYFDRFSHLTNLYQNFRFTPTVSTPKYHWPGEVGRASTYVSAHYLQFQDCQVYVSARADKVVEIQKVLQQHGHKLEDIFVQVVG